MSPETEREIAAYADQLITVEEIADLRRQVDIVIKIANHLRDQLEYLAATRKARIGIR